VSNTNLPLAVPNIGNYSVRDLGLLG
jgi:hypothetical protein